MENQVSNGGSPNYYTTYLKNVLRQQRDERLFDEEFIESRADAASEEYESQRHAGLDVFSAQECAMKVLLEGLE